MEGYEHLVKVAMETEDLIVASNLKFPVKIRTNKKGRNEFQTHGYEVDLVGVRRDLLVLASVKSFFGSKGVRQEGFKGLVNTAQPTPRQRKNFKRYILFNVTYCSTMNTSEMKSLPWRQNGSVIRQSMWNCGFIVASSKMKRPKRRLLSIYTPYRLARDR
jgi:hypothetical protein